MPYKNKEDRRKHQALYKKEHKKEIAISQKKYYEKNKAKLLEFINCQV